MAVVSSKSINLPKEVTTQMTALSKATTAAGRDVIAVGGKAGRDLIAVGGTAGLMRLYSVDPVNGNGECVWREEPPAMFSNREVKSKHTDQISGIHWCQASGMLYGSSTLQDIFAFDLHNSSSEVWAEIC